jgi:Uma2 family endonuclease
MATPRPHPTEEPDLPRPMTWAEWRLLPETTRPQELWLGEKVMSPTPSFRHQDVVFELTARLKQASGVVANTRVILSPFDVRLRDNLVVQPDVLVLTGRAGGRLEDTWVDGPPDLVVEVVSAAGRRRDFVEKASVYAQAGVPEYWVVDPDRGHLVVHRLGANGYDREIAGGDSVACVALDGAEIDIVWMRDLAIGGSVEDEPAMYDADVPGDDES